MFAQLTAPDPDALQGIIAKDAADTRRDKMELRVGVIREADGRAPHASRSRTPFSVAANKAQEKAPELRMLYAEQTQKESHKLELTAPGKPGQFK